MKTTDWYHGTVKPAYAGVYERRILLRLVYSYFDGAMWCIGRNTPEEAAQSAGFRSEYQISPWRGLTEPHCKKCGTEMVEGIAHVTGYCPRFEFPGADMGTVSPGGPGWRIDCYKCPACGWSMTR